MKSKNLDFDNVNLNQDNTDDINTTCFGKGLMNVVFLGRPGSGKSSAIKTMGKELLFTNNILDDGSNQLLKDEVSEGIDYSECQLDNGIKIGFYGTQGQKFINEIQKQALAIADIYVILIDLTSVAPYAEFVYYKNTIETYGNNNALRIVAFTHHDNSNSDMYKLSKEIRLKYYGEILTVKVDPRKNNEMRFMIDQIVNLKLSNIPSEQYYSENRMFLKNINAENL